MMVFYKKLQIKKTALRDAESTYGEYLLNRYRSNTEETDLSEFLPSEWMKAIAVDYANEADRIINKQKNITLLINCIKQNYTKYNEICKAFLQKESKTEDIVSDISIEIERIERELNNIMQIFNDFNNGLPLPNGLTARRLYAVKAELEQKRSIKLMQKAEERADISAIHAEYNKTIKDIKDHTLELESAFSKEIDLLNSKIRKKEIYYNEQINYYWLKLCEYLQVVDFDDSFQFSYKGSGSASLSKRRESIQINESAKQIREIAPLCGIEFYTKDNLFQRDRAFINDTVNSDMDLQYQV